MNNIVDVYVVVTNELGSILNEEILLLKTFASKKYRKQAIQKILCEGTEEEIEDLYLLYKEEVEIMSKRKPFDRQALLRKNVLEVAISCGIAEELKNEGIEQGIEKGIEQGIAKGIEKGIEKGKRKKALKTAVNMKKKGLDIDFIAEVTELDKKYLERFFRFL